MRHHALCTAVIAGTLLIAPAAFAGQQAGSMQDDQVSIDFIRSASPGTLRAASSAAGGGVLGRRSNGAQLGVDSLPNWSSYFYLPGFDSNGNTQFTWPYTMVGQSPFGHGDEGRGGTTFVGAPIVPVNIDLRNADGSPRYVNGQRLYSDATQFLPAVQRSPVFANSQYTSSNRPTQFGDAVQRAEFYHQASDEWHTMLHSSARQARTMVLLKGTYRFALNGDGTCCAYILVDINAFIQALFPPTSIDTSTVMGAAENAHDISTTDLSTFLFPNAYLYFNNDPSQCCVLGFHSYDVEPGSQSNGWRERRYVMDYASWISPGLFGGDLGDITALSHEVSETFNDPFVGNATPWWLSPNGNCQNDLEDGDVIEGLANEVYPITMNGFTYHPQNEAMLQWFAGVSPSNAIGHAYSYPDMGLLTSPAVSQAPGCSSSTSATAGRR